MWCADKLWALNTLPPSLSSMLTGVTSAPATPSSSPPSLNHVDLCRANSQHSETEPSHDQSTLVKLPSSTTESQPWASGPASNIFGPMKVLVVCIVVLVLILLELLRLELFTSGVTPPPRRTSTTVFLESTKTLLSSMYCQQLPQGLLVLVQPIQSGW